eukprot:68646-Hanusia_phi.AAC.1
MDRMAAGTDRPGPGRRGELTLAVKDPTVGDSGGRTGSGAAQYRYYFVLVPLLFCITQPNKSKTHNKKQIAKANPPQNKAKLGNADATLNLDSVTAKELGNPGPGENFRENDGRGRKLREGL